jgi:hypothetical protein
MLVAISNIVASVAGIAIIVGLVWLARSGHGDRDAEDAAREYFDAHGHWPDEAPPVPPPAAPPPHG